MTETTDRISPLLTTDEACRAIGGDRDPISARTLRRLVVAGHIQIVRPTPQIVRYVAESIERYLQSVTFPRKAA
jgi:predicted site-specific integrase-resolvase